MPDESYKAEMERDSLKRIERLKAGDWSFGHEGRHRGPGSEDCPRYMHHHHDAFCRWPTYAEVVAAGIDPREFRVASRRGGN